MGCKYTVRFKRNGSCGYEFSRQTNNVFIALWYLLTISLKYPIVDFQIRRGYIPCEKCNAGYCVESPAKVLEGLQKLNAAVDDATCDGDAQAAEIQSLKTQLAESQRRERAAVEWIQEFTESIDQPCIACKYNTDSPVCNQICGGCGLMGSDSCKWQWRGDAEEDK